MKPLLIVDGYNVIGASKQNAMLQGNLDESRDRLRMKLEDYAGYTGEEVILVFDGYQSDRMLRSEEHYGNLTLVYTRHGETADSYIERLAASCPKYREVRVATSDGLEQSQVFSSGAVRITSRELLRQLEHTRGAGIAGHHEAAGNPGRNKLGKRLPEDVLAALEKIRRSH